jgi:hypothetical protein
MKLTNDCENLKNDVDRRYVMTIGEEEKYKFPNILD